MYVVLPILVVTKQEPLDGKGRDDNVWVRETVRLAMDNDIGSLLQYTIISKTTFALRAGFDFVDIFYFTNWFEFICQYMSIL
jgi:hypothetical protein